MSGLEAHARRGLEWFAEYPGFVGGALHLSQDGLRLVQYLQWDSEKSYHQCIEDARWEENSSSQRFKALVASGDANVDVRIYEVVASSD